MAEHFEIGEIALFVYTDGRTEECQVISPLFTYTPSDGEDPAHEGYDIMCEEPCLDNDSKFGEWFAWKETLRKKHPPQQLSTWQSVEKETGWNPTKIGVEA